MPGCAEALRNACQGESVTTIFPRHHGVYAPNRKKESQGGGNREPQSVVCLRDLEDVRDTEGRKAGYKRKSPRKRPSHPGPCRQDDPCLRIQQGLEEREQVEERGVCGLWEAEPQAKPPFATPGIHTAQARQTSLECDEGVPSLT